MTKKLSAQDFYPGRGTTWPLWMMRQAGRTLPEYQKLRHKADTFFDLVSSAPLIKEITLQPLRRYDVDAAIIFSDILLPLANLPGLHLSFTNKATPCIDFNDTYLDRLEEFVFAAREAPLFSVPEACTLIASELTANQQLIGFCGGVWTISAYVFGGRIPLEWDKIVQKIESMPLESQERWIHILQQLLLQTLVTQYRAGVTQVMIFESWFAFAPPSLKTRWLENPIKKIIESFKKIAPDCPVIYYAQGFTDHIFSWSLSAEILAVGSHFSIGPHQNRDYVFQGNCDPSWLFLPKKELEIRVEQWIESLLAPVVINLGSGLHPETPVENIEYFVKYVRKLTRQKEGVV